MTNSDQIKEAPEPTNQSRQIFENFTDATVALLESPDTSADVNDAVSRMLDMFNNELGGADEPASVNARRVMSNVFNLPAATNGHGEDNDEATVAARELANAFATIHEYWGYLPLDVRNSQLDGITTDILNSVEWEDDPKALREVLMALLRAPDRKVAATKDEAA